MPLIKYLCECGNLTSKFYRKLSDVPINVDCKCGKFAKKQLSGPNSKSITVVDNGVQARAVEVDLELVEDIHNRSNKDFRNK